MSPSTEPPLSPVHPTDFRHQLWQIEAVRAGSREQGVGINVPKLVREQGTASREQGASLFKVLKKPGHFGLVWNLLLVQYSVYLKHF